MENANPVPQPKSNIACPFEQAFEHLPDFEKTTAQQREEYRFSFQHLQSTAIELQKEHHKPIPSIQVVGSKGKGTLLTLLSELLQSNHLRVGSYQSPHLLSRKERFQVNGECISFDNYERIGKNIVAKLKKQNLVCSRFELETLLAWSYFAEKNVDIMIFEAGLGGKNDATSVFHSLWVCLTSIEKEHCKQLGNTLAEITQSKIGMLQKGQTLFTPQLPEESLQTIQRYQNERGFAWNPLSDFPWNYTITPQPIGQRISFCLHNQSHQLHCANIGNHITDLLGLALQCATSVLPALGVNPTDLLLPSSVLNFEWKGKMESLWQQPHLLFDPAHTVQSIRNVILSCAQHWEKPPERLILGLAKDKEINEILQWIQQSDLQEIDLVSLPSERSWKPQDYFLAKKQKVRYFSCITETLDAWEKEKKNTIICGSFQLYPKTIAWTENWKKTNLSKQRNLGK